MEPNQQYNQEPTGSVMPPSQAPHQSSKNNKPILIGLAVLAVLVISVLAAIMLKDKPKTSAPVAITSTATKELRQAAITITKDGFTPASLTVKQGTKVTWTNTDTAPHAIASDPHPTHTNLKGLESINLDQKGTYSYTFTKPGSYTYHDHVNPYKFRGTVVVE